MAEIKKAGIPSKDTVGLAGDIYTNTNTGDKYKLAYIHVTTTYDGTTAEYDWERIWSETSNTDSGIGSIHSNLAMDLEHLTKWFSFIYYDTINQAVIDINDGSVGKNATAENNDSEVAVYIDDIPHVVLLRNCDVSSTIVASTDMAIVLNGYELSAKDVNLIEGRAGKLVIDGRVNGSKIDICSTVSGETLEMIHIYSGECYINGGSFSSTTSDAGEKDNPNGMIVLESEVNLCINNAKLLVKDDGVGAINAIFMKENSTLIGTNCIMEADSQNGLSPDAIYGYGRIELTSCDIEGKSNHVANAAGNDYGATSRAINSLGGSVHLIDCRVRGTHSGMAAKGDLYIDGCVCESYSHGGIYVGAAGKNVYLRNSIIQQCDMPDGYIADKIAGTNNAGIYVGGASNINVYVDNCKFYGIQQPIVLRGTSSESNNHLYISNSCINLDYEKYGIRNDGSNQTHFGVGNNFSSSDLRYKRNYENTENNYADVMPD